MGSIFDYDKEWVWFGIVNQSHLSIMYISRPYPRKTFMRELVIEVE